MFAFNTWAEHDSQISECLSAVAASFLTEITEFWVYAELHVFHVVPNDDPHIFWKV